LRERVQEALREMKRLPPGALRLVPSVPDSDDLAPAPAPARGHRVGPEPSREGMAHPPAGLADEFGNGPQTHAKRGAWFSVEPIVVHCESVRHSYPEPANAKRGLLLPA
jgi:hypothetical protein